MNLIVSHPTGNRNLRQVILSLNQTGQLAKFYTTFCSLPNNFWINVLPAKTRNEFLRRSYPIPPDKIETDPLIELARIILPKLGFSNVVNREHGWASINSVYRHLDKKLALDLSLIAPNNNIEGVYAYEDGAFETFKQAKEIGLKCFYDLPIAFWETVRRLMSEEAERLPNWAITLGGGIKDTSEKLERKSRELELADVVIAPGNFVVDSLPDWAKGKYTIVSPFGTPQIVIKGDEEKKEERPLRVLFAGSMGQRKGLGDLFAAIRLLNTAKIELVVMGSLLAPMDFYRKELEEFTYEPGRPHEEVLALMRTCDVFCLPSIVEGRALVMQEAMSQGLPLIITPNTGGSDLIKDGVTGFLVPIRSPEIIAEKLTWFLENRSQIKEMGRMAQKHAREYTWEKYGNTIVNSLATFLSN
jgi:glycosyltransferase involved in cell wall biosynthesis